MESEQVSRVGRLGSKAGSKAGGGGERVDSIRGRWGGWEGGSDQVRLETASERRWRASIPLLVDGPLAWSGSTVQYQLYVAWKETRRGAGGECCLEVGAGGEGGGRQAVGASERGLLDPLEG